MNGLRRRVSDRAARERFGRRLWQAVVAFGEAFLDQRDLAQVASTTALDQGYVGSQTQPVHVTTGRLVVQSVQDDRELLEILDVVFDT